MKTVLLLLLALPLVAQKVDFVRNVKNGPWVDIRNYGAVCNGTNQNTAVQAAITAGAKRIFIPAGCKWNPPVNVGVGLALIPGGLHFTGENWETSKIWPADVDAYMAIGPLTILENINTNGPGCALRTEGCPVGFYINNNATENQPVQNYPYNQVFVDTGSTVATTRPGAAQHDTNGVAVIQRGQGGGIYGQYNGGVGASSGSGVHAQQSYTSGYGLLVTRTNTGSGQTWWDQTGAATGSTATFTSEVRTGGQYLSFYHQTSNWATGAMIDANMGNSGGSFIADFINFRNGGAEQFKVDYAGRVSVGSTGFASLGTPANGKMLYCTDCTVGATCSGSGTGAWAFGSAGVWKCPF